MPGFVGDSPACACKCDVASPTLETRGVEAVAIEMLCSSPVFPSRFSPTVSVFGVDMFGVRGVRGSIAHGRVYVQTEWGNPTKMSSQGHRRATQY